jgi:NAD dependent epimerase/dehydratase family enzyme
MPMISTRDWVDAVLHLADSDISGPVNLCAERAPTNAEFTRELAHQLHRPAFVRAPAFVIRTAAGPAAGELLGSVNCIPAVLLNSGFVFRDPDVGAVLREGLSPSR